MSGKLDQSLDAIMKDSKTARKGQGRGRNPRRAATAAKAKIAAPAGGISKSTKPAKTGKPTGPTLNAPSTGESKIIVSGLPEDVDETQIKDYFTKTIGHVKRAMLTYGPQGRSRGVATIIFTKPTSAALAAQQLNGVKVDTRVMKIEVVVGAQNVKVPPTKSLGERVTSQPKSAAKSKPKGKENGAKSAAPATNGAKPARGGKKSGRAGRPKAKTAEELDAEMQDYFGDNTTSATSNGAAAQAAAADATMDVIS